MKVLKVELFDHKSIYSVVSWLIMLSTTNTYKITQPNYNEQYSNKNQQYKIENEVDDFLVFPFSSVLFQAFACFHNNFIRFAFRLRFFFLLFWRSILYVIPPLVDLIKDSVIEINRNLSAEPFQTFMFINKILNSDIFCFRSPCNYNNKNPTIQ